MPKNNITPFLFIYRNISLSSFHGSGASAEILPAELSFYPRGGPETKTVGNKLLDPPSFPRTDKEMGGESGQKPCWPNG